MNMIYLPKFVDFIGGIKTAMFIYFFQHIVNCKGFFVDLDYEELEYFLTLKQKDIDKIISDLKKRGFLQTKKGETDVMFLKFDFDRIQKEYKKYIDKNGKSI